MMVEKMRDIAAMQKLLESGTLSYENIAPILNLPDINGGGYVNVNQPGTFYLPPLGFFPENNIAVNKLYDDLRSECLAELFLKDPETIDKLNLPDIQNDFEYVALKNMMQNEQRGIAVIDAMMQASPRNDNTIINILQFAVINGKDNIINHILSKLDNFSWFVDDGFMFNQFIRFLVELSRFDIIKRLIAEDDEDEIFGAMDDGFWDTSVTGNSFISNAEAACRYLKEMLSGKADDFSRQQRINEEINRPYTLKHLVSTVEDFEDLAKNGVTISNATLIAAAIWDENTGDFNDELFKEKIEPLLADNLEFSLSALVDYFSEGTFYNLNISKLIVKTVELVGANRLTVNLSDIYYGYGLSDDEDYAENGIISSINGNAVKALLKIPNYCADADDSLFHLIEKLAVHTPRLIIGLVKKGAITGKLLDAVLDVAINCKNYELLNQLRLAVPSIK